MNRLSYLRSVKFMMAEFVSSRKPLTIWVMKRIHADDANAILYVSHTGEIVVQRRVLQHDVPCLDDAFDRHRWRADPEVSD